MAAETVGGRKLERSLSCNVPESESLPSRSISHRKSIVNALWNYLAPRRHGSPHQSVDPGSLQQLQGEDIDHGEGSTRQEEAWWQAYYNGVALVVLVVAGCLCWALYCVLEPFLHPLLWAVLTGILLHPFKKTWTDRISQWLKRLESNSIPLSAGLVLSPLFLFNHVSKILEASVVTYWWAILGSTVAAVFVWLLYKFSFPLHIYNTVGALRSFLLALEEALASYAWSFQLLTVLLGFALLMVVARSSLRYLTAFSILSTVVWFLALLHIAAYVLGSALALPLVIGLFLTGGVVSFATALKGFLGMDNKSTKSAKLRGWVGEEEEGGGEGVEREREEAKDDSPALLEEVRCSGDLSEAGGEEGEEIAAETGLRVADVELASENDRPNFEGPADVEQTKSHVSFGAVTRFSPEKPAEEKEAGRKPTTTAPHKAPTMSEAARSQSYYIFLGLYSMFFVVVFWTYPFLLVLLVPFIVWGALKRVILFSINQKTAVGRVTPILRKFQEWVSLQRALLFPAPLPTLSRLFLSLDRTVLKFAKGSVDSLISLVIIVGLLVSGLGLAVFLVLQIQVELSHYVAMMGAVWERVVESSPQLEEWIGGGKSGEGQSIHDTFGSFATHGYMYGREWLASQVQSALGGSSEKGSAMEKQVLNLYDQLYQSYVLANSTTTGGSHGSGLTNSGDLLNEAKIIVMENLETIISVLKSMWVVVADNISLALSLLYSVLGLLLSGGTALINAVVFLTTLFYLLCYSSDVYLPVKIVLDVLPSVTQSDTAGHYTASFARAIRSVFHASFSRLVFYGLYTWLVHTAFGLPVSVLPAVLAAIAGALPFVGTYWIALPAVLELWLVEGQPLSAITVLILSLLPLFFVDSIIYGEVEGGHPYLTGLAVAGGIYFAGLEGALIGPILLCCLVFIHELFDDLGS